jgi:hypothetical protein
MPGTLFAMSLREQLNPGVLRLVAAKPRTVKNYPIIPPPILFGCAMPCIAGQESDALRGKYWEEDVRYPNLPGAVTRLHRRTTSDPICLFRWPSENHSRYGGDTRRFACKEDRFRPILRMLSENSL